MSIEDFRGFFPGSKQPLPPIDEPTPEPPKPEPTWDAKPVLKKVNGADVEFFTIGAVATALNKSPITIRLWIREGHLPAAIYRMPTKNEIKGRRLYTRGQVDAVIAVAKQHGLITQQRVRWDKHPTFANEVRQAWNDLPPL